MDSAMDVFIVAAGGIWAGFMLGSMYWSRLVLDMQDLTEWLRGDDASD